MMATAALFGAAAAVLGLGAIYLAWRKTKGRPVIRTLSVTIAVLFALILNVIVKEINREMARQSARSQGLELPSPAR
jgi:uncharacterized membrane protein